MSKMAVAIIIFAGLATLLLFAALGWWSGHGASAAFGMDNNKLKPCGDAPNCVCSEADYASDASHYVAPVSISGGAGARAWASLAGVVGELGGAIVEQRPDYLHATFTSAIFRFVDDFELRLEDDQIHLRSASRVGYSDLGANAKRVEAVKQRYAQTRSAP